MTGKLQPLLVLHSLVGRDAVVLGNGDQAQAGGGSRSATAIRPRLRSTKRSGSPAGCGTQDVLELIDGHAELPFEVIERVTCPEALEHIVDARAAPFEDRRPKARFGSATTAVCSYAGTWMSAA